MGTSFDQVEDLALIIVDDYKILKLYNKNEEQFKKYCDGFLISAIPNFTACRTSLSYNLEEREFDYILTNLEVSILADLWVMAWLTREVQNSTQIQLKLQTTGSFKNHSSAQNLKEKASYLGELREKVNKRIITYELQAPNMVNNIF